MAWITLPADRGHAGQMGHPHRQTETGGRTLTGLVVIELDVTVLVSCDGDRQRGMTHDLVDVRRR